MDESSESSKRFETACALYARDLRIANGDGVEVIEAAVDSNETRGRIGRLGRGPPVGRRDPPWARRERQLAAREREGESNAERTERSSRVRARGGHAMTARKWAPTVELRIPWDQIEGYARTRADSLALSTSGREDPERAAAWRAAESWAAVARAIAAAIESDRALRRWMLRAREEGDAADVG